MRRHKLNWIWIIVLGVFFGSCEDYLNRSPNDGFSEDAVYKDYNSLSGFMDRIFLNNSILIYTYDINSYANQYVTVGNLSDEYASVRNDDPSKFVNAGNWLENAGARFEVGSKVGTATGNLGATAIARAYTGLRIVNRVINGVDKVQSITDEQKQKLLGQAYFLRAYFYFEVIKRYGGMPIFDALWGASDNFDLPRKTYQESNKWMQTDLDKAIEYLPTSWPEEEHVAQTFADYQLGDIAYKDLNGDKVIDDRDVKELGNSFPRTTFGLDFSLSYKGWGLYLQGYAELGVNACFVLVVPSFGH